MVLQFDSPQSKDQLPDLKKFQEKIIQDPGFFLRECLGQNPWEMEIKIIESVRDNPKTMVAGCVSSGKTHATAGLVFWWLMAFAPMARIFCLAPTERQLKINLWREIPRMHSASRIRLGGEMMPLSLQYRLGDDWYALGFSPQDQMGVFGIHGPHDLIVIDDAQGLKQEIWEALENAMAGGTTRLLASCNPVVTSGEIYEAMTSKRGKYNVIRIPAAITPNVKEGKIIIPGMITKETVDRWVQEYGEDSDFVRTKVKALLPKQEPDTLIPLDWIEAAMVREAEVSNEYPILGVDVARFGDDRTVIFPIQGLKALDPIILQGADTMEVAGRVKFEMENHKAGAAFVDVIGIGSGVCDRLAEQGVIVYPVNVASKARNEKKFVNLRSEVWWAAREALDPKNQNIFALPNNKHLMAELAASKFIVDSSGRIRVEPKDDMKKRLGHSPDLADAFCLAMYGRYVLQYNAYFANHLIQDDGYFIDTEGFPVGTFEAV
ncbi:MAG: hypothetical protein ACKVQC_05890 [Elusimicrobiota bacterium]